MEQDVKVAFNKEVARNTFLMGLISREIAAEAGPGQFVMIKVRDGMDPLLRRPFSISGVRGRDLFLILYRVVGKGTAILSKAREGDGLKVLGPLGRGFEPPAVGGRWLLVAGGIGVAPLLYLAQKGKAGRMDFMVGFRSADEVLPFEEFGLRDHDMILSTEDGTAGRRGLITDFLRDYMVHSGKEVPMVFTCGPLAMTKRVVPMSLERKIPCQVSLEAFMACGLGACQGCVVKAASKEGVRYYRVCRDGPVFEAPSLDWKSL